MIRVSKLVVAAALAATLPAAAVARGCDHPGEGVPAAWGPAGARPLPAPPAPRVWREARWRERELATLRAEFHALEEERARFHARYGHRPGKLRRYERRYEARRAELERRWYALQAVAIR